MWTEPIYDCQQCGACCVNPGYFAGTAYVYLTKDEAKRMKRTGLSVVQAAGHAYLGTRASLGSGGRAICVAFTGQVGGQCGCSIYPTRPRGCRQFQVGSPECKAARRQAGLSA
jgi:uncharacterized protein